MMTSTSRMNAINEGLRWEETDRHSNAKLSCGRIVQSWKPGDLVSGPDLEAELFPCVPENMLKKLASGTYPDFIH